MCFRCSGDNSSVIPRGSGGGSSYCSQRNVSSKGNSWRGNECSSLSDSKAHPGPCQVYSVVRDTLGTSSERSFKSSRFLFPGIQRGARAPGIWVLFQRLVIYSLCESERAALPLSASVSSSVAGRQFSPAFGKHFCS